MPPLLVIAGATATGKTGLAIRVALALRTDGMPVEIISADSRQVYRGLDIGTAKATVAERQGIPHHGLDLVEPDQPFSVAEFAAHVASVLAHLGSSDGLAILAGGTGLYLRTIARGIDIDALPADSDVRARIEAEIADVGVEAAAMRLRSLAPVLAKDVDLQNPRRVARALEIAELRGDGPRPAPVGYPGPARWIGLDVEPTAHARWIADRARAQFDAGLVEEAAALRERYDPSLRAFSAIGYHEAWSLLDGEIDRATAIALDAQRNLAFAKHQRTWFRRERGIEWHDPSAEDPVPKVLGIARALMESRPAAGRT